MKIFNFIIFTFLFGIFSLSTTGQDTIHWSPHYKLKWEDFKGKPDNTSQFGAVSYPGVKYTLSANDDTFYVNVFCFFIKSKSWVRIISTTGLTHEQGHFDIAELFARRLRKAFAGYNFNYPTVGKDIDNLFLTYKLERTNLDNLYDKETDFSRNRKMQQYWNEKIAQELKELDQFKQQ